MKKLLFSAVGVLAIVGTALAVNTTKLGSTIYRQGSTPGVCNVPVSDRTVLLQNQPGAIPDFATATPGAPCRNTFSITSI